jgi:hypothetical protein
MKVAVVMFYDDNIKCYGDLNYTINKMYCEKYNLDFIFSNQKQYKNRHSAWERLPLLIKNLPMYDYLMWIDADAFFYKDAGNIVNIIEKNKDVNFIFSNDIGNTNINTGFFIVKNTEYSIEFLKKWAYDEQLYKKNPKPAWWDQGVLVYMFNNNILNIKKNCVYHDYGILQHFHEIDKQKNTYIYHLAGKKSQIRCDTSKKYLDYLNSVNKK